MTAGETLQVAWFDNRIRGDKVKKGEIDKDRNRQGLMNR